MNWRHRARQIATASQIDAVVAEEDRSQPAYPSMVALTDIFFPTNEKAPVRDRRPFTFDQTRLRPCSSYGQAGPDELHLH